MPFLKVEEYLCARKHISMNFMVIFDFFGAKALPQQKLHTSHVGVMGSWGANVSPEGKTKH